MKALLVSLLLAALCLQPKPLDSQALPKPETKLDATAVFDKNAAEALDVMRAKAVQMGVQGAAVVCYFEGNTIQSWSSHMLVVGISRKDPKDTDKGANLLAIAYAKAGEMADTLKDSGTAGRPPLTGEFGWNGGVITKTATGYVIAAFSGGKSEDDVAISKEGLAKLKSAF